MTTKQIIAIGGEVISHDPLIPLYILAAANKRNPHIALVPTASGDDYDLMRFFYALFDQLPCVPTHISLVNHVPNNLESRTLDQDILLVSGGHTAFMLDIWRNRGFDTILRKAYDQGTVLAGGSAGSVCWFDECITDSVPGKLTVMPCLGFLPYSSCPHFASRSRRRAYGEFLKTGEIKPGYANDDEAALHFVDGKYLRSVSRHPTHKGHYCSWVHKRLDRKPLETKFLGLPETQEEFFGNSSLFV